MRTTLPLSRDAANADPAISALTLTALFGFELGEVSSGPTPGGDAHVVARLGEIRPANPAADREEVERLGETLRVMMANDLLEQYRAALAADFTVSVDQRVLESVLDPGSSRRGF